MKQVRIKGYQIKQCENPDGSKTQVLDLSYKIGWETWRVLLKDYNYKYHTKYLNQLKEKIREWYNNFLTKKDETNTTTTSWLESTWTNALI